MQQEHRNFNVGTLSSGTPTYLFITHFCYYISLFFFPFIYFTFLPFYIYTYFYSYTFFFLNILLPIVYYFSFLFTSCPMMVLPHLPPNSLLLSFPATSQVMLSCGSSNWRPFSLWLILQKSSLGHWCPSFHRKFFESSRMYFLASKYPLTLTQHSGQSC